MKASYFPAGEESANNDLNNCLKYFLQALYHWEYQPLLCTSWLAVEEALKKLKRKKEQENRFLQILSCSIAKFSQMTIKEMYENHLREFSF